MATSKIETQPMPPERSLYMRNAAAQAAGVLERFSGNHVDFDPTALQLLDEWIERLTRKGPVPPAAQALAIAFLGHTFLHIHGGYWATRSRGHRQSLGVICPVEGPGDGTRFIDIAEQVDRRLSYGILESLTFFYLTTSVELRGRF